ncbi:uncharacterized protein C2orf81 homolog [Lepisosteus oculatus]|uniref:uncharacterized protein C2orf81 homolog n=1 Tax=Lepisosteus oculatus TaxID=7918 RepID=UPI0037242462
MSRSLSKSRAEKSRAPSVPAAPPAPSASAPADIVPGRLAESDWVSMVAREEGEEVVVDVVEGLMARVMEECYRVYLQRQLVPFTVSQAREALVQMVEWRFLVRDEGEGPESAPSWEEDLEPLPCGPDSWAQGCVPVLHTGLTPRPPLTQRAVEATVGEADSPGRRQPETKLQPEEEGTRRETANTEHLSQNRLDVDIRGENEKKGSQGPKKPKPHGLTPAPPPKTEKRRKPSSHRAAAPTPLAQHPSKSLPSQGGSTVQQESQPNQAKQDRPAPNACLPQPLNAISAVEGAMQKLSLARLPQHRICPGFEVLEPETLQCNSGKTGGALLPRPVLERRHKQDGASPPLPRVRIPNRDAQKLQRSNVPLPSTSSRVSADRDARGDTGLFRAPLPLAASLLLDSMELSPGVALKDARGIRMGPWKEALAQPRSSTALKPIRTTLSPPLISLEQLITGHQPQVTPQTTLAGQT